MSEATLLERLRTMYSHRGDGIPTQFVNPDGPEAADLIERLTSTPAGEALIGALGTCRKRLEVMSHVEGGTLDQNCLFLIGVIDSALSTAPSPSPVARVPDREEIARTILQSRNMIPGTDWDDGMTEGIARIELMLAEKAADRIVALFTASPSDGSGEGK